MGTNHSSPELSDHALRTNALVDTQLLMYSSLDLMDIEWAIKAYLECLQNGTLLSNIDSSWRLKKIESLAEKANDTELVLAASMKTGEFTRKQTKIFERIIAELTSNADLYHDSLQARLALVKRVHIAYLRTRKREITEGKPCQMSVDDKRIWLSTLLMSGVEAESALLLRWLDDYERQETTERAKQAEEAQRAKREESRRSLERARDNVRQRVNTLRTHLDIWARQRSATVRSPQTSLNPYASSSSHHPSLPSLPPAPSLLSAAAPSTGQVSSASQSTEPAGSSALSGTSSLSSTSSSPTTPAVYSPAAASSEPSSDAAVESSSVSVPPSYPVLDSSTEYASFVASVLNLADNLPELIGLTGLLGMPHPREKTMHQERINQKSAGPQSNAPRRSVQQPNVPHRMGFFSNAVRRPPINQTSVTSNIDDAEEEDSEQEDDPVSMSFIHPPHGRVTNVLSSSDATSEAVELLASAINMARHAAEHDGHDEESSEDDEEQDMDADPNEYGSVPDSQDNSSAEDYHDDGAEEQEESYEDEPDNDDGAFEIAFPGGHRDEQDEDLHDDAFDMDMLRPADHSAMPASLAASLVSELSGALDRALSSNEDSEMLRAIALSLGLGDHDASMSQDALSTSTQSAVSPAASTTASSVSTSLQSGSSSQPQPSQPSIDAPLTSSSEVASSSPSPATNASSQLQSVEQTSTAVPHVNVDMDAELAAGLLNGGEDEEFARAIALSLELSQPAPVSVTPPPVQPPVTAPLAATLATAAIPPTVAVTTAAPSGPPVFATICAELIVHLDQLSELVQHLPERGVTSSTVEPSGNVPAAQPSVTTSQSNSGTNPSSSSVDEVAAVQPDTELTSVLAALGTIRGQLRARCAEDRQAQFASGLLSNQRHDEQHALTIVNELEAQVRDMLEQSRRFTADSGSAAATSSAGSSSALSAHSDRQGGVWTSSGLSFSAAAQSAVPVPRSRRSTAIIPLEENDIKFNCSPLLKLVLDHAGTQCKSLVDREAVASSTTKSSTLSLPAVRLLHLLQMDLFRKAAVVTDPSDAVVSEFTDYVCGLLDVTRSVLERVTVHHSASSSLESDCCLSKALYHSVVGICAPPAVLAIYHLLQQPAFASLSSVLFPVLCRFVDVLNTVANMFSGSTRLDTCDIAQPPLVPHSLRVVESAHAYLANQDDEHIVTITGADFLSLEFDPRCSTERSRDVLDILGEDHTLIASLEGESGAWPIAPVVVKGSSVVIRFHAESVNPSSRFGYRIVVKGMKFPSVLGHIEPHKKQARGATKEAPKYVPSNSSSFKDISSDVAQSTLLTRDSVVEMHTLPFLFELLNMTCRLLGRCAHLSVVGEPAGPSEKRLTKWLASPLFSQGFEKDHPSAENVFVMKSAIEPPPAVPEVEPVRIDGTIPPDRNINATSNVDVANTVASIAQSRPAAAVKAVKPAPVSVLDDSFVIGSGSDAEFLVHFIDLHPDSAGAAFDAAMRKLVRPMGPEMLGGVVVKRTVRCFVAALLKHMGLSSTARAFVSEQAAQSLEKARSSSAFAAPLVDVWKKGSLMHRWIVSQRQSLQQLHLARQQQLEAEGKPMSAEMMAAAEKRLEYDGFCSGVFNKALYLLSVRPCLTQPPKLSGTVTPGLDLASEVSTTLALSRTLSNELTLVRTNSSGGRARDGNESFLSLFSVYKTLQHFNAYKADRHRDKDSATGTEENVIDLLALLVQSDVPVGEFARLIAVQSKRAHQRLAAMDSVFQLAQSLSFDTCRIGLLHSFSNPFRAYQRYAYGTEQQGRSEVGSHYYTNIESCDVRVRGKARQSFLRLYKYLATLINDESSVESLRLVAMDCWAVEFIPLDHSQLLSIGVFGTLSKMAESKHSASLTTQQVAHALLRLLFASQSRFDTKNQLKQNVSDTTDNFDSDDSSDSSPPWTIDPIFGPSGLDRLQQYVVDTLFMGVYHSLSLLNSLRRELGDSRLSDLQIEQQPPSFIICKQYLDAEEAAYLNLASLSSIVTSVKHALQYVISTNVLQLLLRMLQTGSARLQRMSLSLLARVFTKLSVSQFDALKLDIPSHSSCVSPFGTGTSSFIHYVLASIGSLSFGNYQVGVKLDSEEPKYFNPYDHRSGAVNLSLAAAYISFIREVMHFEDHEKTSSHDNLETHGIDAEMKSKVDDESRGNEELDDSQLGANMLNNTSLGWSSVIAQRLSDALSSLIRLSSQQRASGFSLDADDSFCSPDVYPSVLLALASISVLGGYDDRIRVGGCVQTSSNDSTAPPEVGTVVFLDREAARVKVVFDHSPTKVIECQMAKLRPFVLRVPDSSLLIRFPGVLDALAAFIDGLLTENKAALQQKALRQRKRLAEFEQERKEAENQRAKVVVQTAAPVAIDDHPWECEICTFLNTSSLRAVCEMCGSNNPLAQKLESASRNLKPVVAQAKPKTPRTALLLSIEGEDERKLQIELVTADQFLYHALRSRAIQAMCHLLGQPSSARHFLAASKLLPELLLLATRPTLLNGFHSVHQLGLRDDRLLELIQEKAVGMANDHKRFLDRAKGAELRHSPFVKLDVLLPNSFDLGVARSVSFLTDDCSTIQYSRQKNVAVAVVRSNHLIPNSLPAFYFEVTVLDAGSIEHASNPFGVAVGLFRSGMPLKGFPGSSNSYAISSSGEVHSTQAGGSVQRRTYASGFKTGDVIGCLWNLRKKSVQFIINGQPIDSDTEQKGASSVAFSGVDGRFHPAVWIEADNARIIANFGQNPFKYDFASTLPLGYLSSVSSSPTSATEPRSRTAAEIKRRTQAEDLALITSFPIDLCEVALEQKSDDMERAVDFLLQHGHQELERMAAESIRQSQLMEENRKMRMLGVADSNLQGGDDDDDETEDLAEWLTGPAAPAAAQPNANASSRNWASVGGSWLGPGAPQQQQQQQAAARRPNSGSSPASMLDDEIEQDVPIGVELPSTLRNQQHVAAGSARADDPSSRMSAEQIIRTQNSLQEPLKVDDIACGYVLAVCDNVANIAASATDDSAFGLSGTSAAFGRSDCGDYILPVSHFKGRSGIVCAVNVNTKSVQLLFVDTDVGVKHCCWFPVAACTKPQRLWVDPCLEQRGMSWKAAAYEFISNEQALSVRNVRSAIQKLFSSWPADVSFSLQSLGGPAAVMDMLKLSASEVLSTSFGLARIQSLFSQSTKSMEAFQHRLGQLIREEAKVFENDHSLLPDVRIDESMYQIKQADVLANMLADTSKSHRLLIPRIVEEIIVHFVQAVNHPIPALTFRSPHPYPSHSDVREKVSIPGASKLLVTFDTQCQISEDMLTRLAFCRDSSYQDVVMTCTGRYGAGHGQRWQSFMITGDTLYFKFSSGVNTDNWGYKFKVTPVELRINDEAALNGLNIELGAWLFEFFLTHASGTVLRRYARNIYDAIVWFVCHAKPSAKSRGVELLVRFLLHVHQMNTYASDSSYRSLDFSKLAPLQAQMNQVLDSMNEADYRGGLSSPALQGLIELLATTDLVKSQAMKQSEAAQPITEQSDAMSDSYDGSTMLDVSSLGVYSMKIHSVRYFPAQQESVAIDVTSTVQTYLESCGSSQLYLPLNGTVLEKILGVSQWSGRERKLHLRYSVMRRMFDVESNSIRDIHVKDIEKTIAIPATFSRSTPNPCLILKALPSPFDGIVELSRFTLEMQATGEFVPDFKQEIVRAQQIASTFFPLVSSEGLKLEQKDRLVVPDSSGVQGSAFTFMTWIYIPDTARADANTEASGSITSVTSTSLSSASSPSNRRGGRLETTRPTATATATAPLRSLLHKGNYNAELALSSSQSSGWSHAHAHLYSSGVSITLGPQDDHRVSLTLYSFRNAPQLLTSAQSLPVNQWSHVAVTVTRHSARIVINGVEDSSRKLQGHRKISNDPFFLGKLPIGTFDISDDRYGSMPRGQGFEDESRRTGVSASVKDARWVGYSIEPKDLLWYYKCVTKYNSSFQVTDANSTVASVWREKKAKKPDIVAANSTESNDSAAVAVQASVPSDQSSETLQECLPALFSQGPLLSVADLRLSIIPSCGPRFTPAMDTQIIEYAINQLELEMHRARAVNAREQSDATGSLVELQAYSPSFTVTASSLASYHLISQIIPDKIRARLVAIQTVNWKLAVVLPLVDFSQAGSSWSLAHRLSSMSWLILREVKTRTWSSILRQTGSQGTTTFITINRPRALRAKEKGDLSGMKSVFGQVYCQLHFLRPALLRTDQRPWRATFEGEGGTDAGGLFRDSVSHMCSELQSTAIPLFIPCPNNRTKIGDNQDKWIPHPASTSSVHISMFAFVGKLMGIAIRGGHMLNLDLPPLIFKPLVGTPLTRADLAAVDALTFDVLDKISTVDEEQAEELMDELALTFTTQSSDGRTIDLKPAGATLPVTAVNRTEYCSLVEQYRLHEFDVAIAAIRKGLSTIVPIQLLPLFTPSELESMICGKREIAVDYLRANTRYRSPISPQDRHVAMFWDVLSSFSHEERQLFIRFVWGQSRLPSNPADFTQKFEIWPHPTNNDKVLPVSHTCFFSLELPRYSMYDIMRNKLLYAINNGYAIDTDHVADNLDWNAD